MTQQRLCVLLAELTVLAFAFMPMVSAEDRYVATNLNGNGSSWANATNSIQGAIDAISGAYVTNTVWVSNGVYETGGSAGFPIGTLLTNRVAIWKAITVRSANNDPANTIIKGQWSSMTPPNGTGAVRCVYMTNGSFLIGFTLTNGATLTTNESGNEIDKLGGGVYGGGTISNCVISGNSSAYRGGGVFAGNLFNCNLTENSARQGGAIYQGGGAYGSTLSNCTLSGNSVPYASSCYGGGAYNCTLYSCTLSGNNGGKFGGGAYMGTLYNCLLIGNTATDGGGGMRDAKLYNCTVVGNFAWIGGGVYGGTLSNCIVYFNDAHSAPVNYTNVLAFSYSCTTPTVAGTGNITNDPAFVTNGNGSGTNHVAGNYRLTHGSPCVNSGINQPWMLNAADLDGHSRIDRFFGIVDMGCYEYLSQGTMFSVP